MASTGVRWGSVVLGVLLVVDGLATALGVARVFSAGVYVDAAGGLLVAARVVAGALDLAAGGLVIRSRPPGAALAMLALVVSAALTTAEAGLGRAFSALEPAARWSVVAGAWIYALGWIWYLRRSI